MYAINANLYCYHTFKIDCVNMEANLSCLLHSFFLTIRLLFKNIKPISIATFLQVKANQLLLSLQGKHLKIFNCVFLLGFIIYMFHYRTMGSCSMVDSFTSANLYPYLTYGCGYGYMAPTATTTSSTLGGAFRRGIIRLTTEIYQKHQWLREAHMRASIE